jgi:uncharacterized membrane protein YoaK (UPF0700 family)
MTRYDRRTRFLAVCLSALAGYIDAAGFMSSGGFFISFMSGNSTKLAVGLATRSMSAVIAASLVSSFLLGVVAGSLVSGLSGHYKRSRVLALVACGLLLSAALASAEYHWPVWLSAAAAMGAENAAFEEDGEIRIGLTYMTGTLVKIGQRVASALRGGELWGWIPYLLQWGGLLSGAVIGAIAVTQAGAGCLWFASFAATILLLFAWMLERPRSRS